MAFLEQKLIYTINIWFNFQFGSFFVQHYLLNLIILGVYAKIWPKCSHISKQKLMQPKIWSIIFCLTLTFGGPFHTEDIKLKKYGGTGLISKKTEALYAKLNEIVEAATSSYSSTGDFLQYIYCFLFHFILTIIKLGTSQ